MIVVLLMLSKIGSYCLVSQSILLDKICSHIDILSHTFARASLPDCSVAFTNNDARERVNTYIRTLMNTLSFNIREGLRTKRDGEMVPANTNTDAREIRIIHGFVVDL